MTFFFLKLMDALMLQLARLATLNIITTFVHVVMKVILNSTNLRFPMEVLFRRQAPILRDGHKTHVHMWRCFIVMYHGI
ncbi:hypothetical protein A7P25_19525 [Achromobacter xylosoxidans]|nr:hypothetical protein A7P25_19525 [Achromobacter xylosoxidans]